MKVKVHYLFSRNKKIGSRLISWGTGHLQNEEKTPSHIAVLINERWVFESVLEKGVRVISYEKWLANNEEVAKISCCEIHREYKEVKNIFKDIQDKKYDWPGIMYFGWRISLNKAFKIKIPEINKWEKSDRYFCCEAVAKLTNMENSEMKAPVDMLAELRVK